jgi:hypothetical protein
MAGLWLAAALSLAPGEARADTFSDYAPAGSFSLPGSFPVADSLPDGRLIVVSLSTVSRETSAGSHSFVVLGTLPGADMPTSFAGAAFVRVSPDGTKIAVGNNGGSSFSNFQVGVFTLSTLTGTWFAANHLDGEWVDNRFVALTAGSGSVGVVTVLDSTSANPASPVNVTVVTNIGGASGGIAFDSAGNLYTADGFQGAGPSGTGAVYEFSSAAWHAALSGGPALNFETQGVPIADMLSGSPIAFDSDGDLFIGGGNSFGTPVDDNYFAIVRASAVAAARSGGGFVNASDPTKVLKPDPDPASGDTYALVVNPARREVDAIPFNSNTAYAYRALPAAAPALPAWAVLLLASGIALLGFAKRRTNPDEGMDGIPREAALTAPE